MEDKAQGETLDIQ